MSTVSQLQPCIDQNCACCTSSITCTTVTSFDCKFTHSQILLMKNQNDQTMLIIIAVAIFAIFFAIFIIVICFIGRNSFKLYRQKIALKKTLLQQMSHKRQANQSSRVFKDQTQQIKMRKISDQIQTNHKSKSSIPYVTPSKLSIEKQPKNEFIGQSEKYKQEICKSSFQKNQDKTTVPKMSLIGISSSMTYIMKTIENE